jgi:methylated-DNA-[protein]-cysteine S-methyltransferase
MNIYYQLYESPVGCLKIASFNNRLCLADWNFRKMRKSIDNRISNGLKSEFKAETSEVIEQTKEQLTEYFHKQRTQFDLPIRCVGTPFQVQVWEALQKIPIGKTETYLGLSRLLGNEKAIRAVAAANGANAISIIIPCHRIIGSDGSLVGYAGGLSAKKKLLLLEGGIQNSQFELF